MHRAAEAIAAATEAVRLEPGRADRHEVLAEALSQDDQATAARAAAREAVRLAPRSVSALLTLTGYAAGGPPALAIVAVAAAPLLWGCMMLERLGHVRGSAGPSCAARWPSTGTGGAT